MSKSLPSSIYANLQSISEYDRFYNMLEFTKNLVNENKENKSGMVSGLDISGTGEEEVKVKEPLNAKFEAVKREYKASMEDLKTLLGVQGIDDIFS